MNIQRYNLSENKSILNWDEALPLGNGKIGSLIYGNGPIKIAIDRIDLWDNRPLEKTKKKDFNYKRYIKCCTGTEKDWETKVADFDIRPALNYPTKLSAGRLILDFGRQDNEIISKLDITKAIANVKAKDIEIESFVCATKPVGVIKIKGEYNLSLHIPDYISKEGTKNCLGYPESTIIKESGYTYYEQKTLTDYTYTLICLEKKESDNSYIYYTVYTSDDSKSILACAKKLLKECEQKGYEQLFNEHKNWWKKYWQKSNIKVGDEEIESTYYRSWYLFGSTSREKSFPMPLQGVWTADDDNLPPWKGDYHHDTNTQMSYWAYGKANRLKEGRVFADYLWELRNKFKEFAKEFYNVEGYIVPGTSSINGEFMGGWAQFSLSPTMTIWSAKSFDDYYYYTGDLNFLRERAYPFFKGVESSIRSLLVEKDGKYYLPLSSSPEIYEEKKENFLIGNTNFDQSLIIYLYNTMIEYSKILNKSSKEYEEVLKKLDEIYIDEDKTIKLSKDRRMPYSHRHFSHLMCVYPLNLLKNDSERNETIIKNSMLEIEQLGTGWWVGFSFPWCATLYSRIYNGNAAYEKLRIFSKGFVSPNGFHLNGDYKNKGFSQWHYRPFTLEANVAFCDAVQEMLLQDEKGYIELFPAIPNEWKKKVEFNKLRVKGGILISAKMKNGEITFLNITASKECSIKIKIDKVIKEILLKKGKNVIKG